jgi:hypothetical protein
MAKKMKLIPESLYKQMLGAYKHPSNYPYDTGLEAESSLQSEKKSVLSASDVPDDIKQILYHDFARTLYEKQQKESKRPLLVKTSADESKQSVNAPSLSGGSPETPSSSSSSSTKQKPTTTTTATAVTSEQLEYIQNIVGSKRTGKILNAMLSNGISFNSNNNVTVDEAVIPNSNIVEILRCLTNSRLDNSTVHGLQDVVYKLKSANVPHSLFTGGVRKSLFRSPSLTRTRSASSSPRKRRKSRTSRSWDRI